MNRAATPSPPARWRGTLTLAPTAAIFAGTGGDTPAHAHLAHQIVIGAVAAGPASQLRDGRDPIAIPAGASHRVLADQRAVVLVYLDARRVRWPDVERLAARWQRLRATERPGDDGGPVAGAVIDAILEDVTAIDAWAADARALAAVDAMARGDTLVEVSRRLALSESRVTHLVTEQLGAPPRAWRTWLRLRTAIDLVADGDTVTGAAHAAGFADASHFSRSCSLALGIPPSALRATRVERTRVGRCVVDQAAA